VAHGRQEGALRLVGRLRILARAKELILTGRLVGADEARERGLVNAVFEPGELMDKTLAFARDLAAKAPIALAAAKEAINRSLGGDHAENLDREGNRFGELFASGDAKEGLTAFVEKRDPRFSGR
jgi:enoyl-CoA hydratase/carnithine racemase